MIKTPECYANPAACFTPMDIGPDGGSGEKRNLTMSEIKGERGRELRAVFLKARVK